MCQLADMRIQAGNVAISWRHIDLVALHFYDKFGWSLSCERGREREREIERDIYNIHTCIEAHTHTYIDMLQ